MTEQSEFSREISTFSRNTRDEVDVTKLQETKGRLELAMWLSKDRERKAVLHLKINIVKARINEVLRRT